MRIINHLSRIALEAIDYEYSIENRAKELLEFPENIVVITFAHIDRIICISTSMTTKTYPYQFFFYAPSIDLLNYCCQLPELYESIKIYTQINPCIFSVLKYSRLASILLGQSNETT